MCRSRRVGGGLETREERCRGLDSGRRDETAVFHLLPAQILGLTQRRLDDVRAAIRDAEKDLATAETGLAKARKIGIGRGQALAATIVSSLLLLGWTLFLALYVSRGQ